MLGILSTGIITAIISLIIFKVKYEFDKNYYHNKIANEKLVRIINPLLFLLIIETDSCITENLMIIENLKNEGSLLRSDLFNGLMEMIKIEKDYNIRLNDDSKIKCIKDEKYKHIRKQIIKKLEIEKSELLRLTNKKFEEYMEIELSSKSVRSIYYIEKMGSYFITIFVFAVVYFFTYLDVYDDPFLGGENSYINTAFIILAVLIFSLFLLSFTFMIFNIIKQLNKGFAEKKGRYGTNSIVKESSNYRCRVCGEIVYQYEGSWFTYCRHKNRKNVFKEIFFSYYWEKNPETSLNTTVQNMPLQCLEGVSEKD